MASFVYTYEAAAVLTGRFISNNALADIRVLLVSSNTTADTDRDIQFVGGLGTLDEFVGTGYTAGGRALTTEAVNRDDANDRGEFDATDLLAGTTGWPGLGASANNRDIVGILGYHFVTNNADSPNSWFDDSASQLPFDGNGSDVGITWNAEGIVQATTT